MYVPHLHRPPDREALDIPTLSAESAHCDLFYRIYKDVEWPDLVEVKRSWSNSDSTHSRSLSSEKCSLGSIRPGHHDPQSDPLAGCRLVKLYRGRGGVGSFWPYD